MTMPTKIINQFLVPFLFIPLIACGGGGGGDGNDDPDPGDTNNPPSASFSQPLENTSIAEGNSLHVIVEANDSDGSIASVRLSLNGVLVREDSESPFEWANPDLSNDEALRNMAPGDYTLTAVAVDNDGAETSINREFTVTTNSDQNAPPVVSFTQPLDGKIFEQGETAHVIVEASDSDGTVANVRLSLNGTFIRQENIAPYEWGQADRTDDLELRNMAPGEYQLVATALDDKGSETSANISFTVEATEPGSCTASGDLRRWHRVEILCEGFSADEADDETFTDYRFNVVFTQDNVSITVPGHFAADGNAADSGASNGDIWRAYFSPPTMGNWQYQISFRSGQNIAVDQAVNAGVAVDSFDGESGSFTVASNPSPSLDMRTRGLLEHRDNERYLRHAGDNSIYIEGGMDSPENIFGYSDFDNTTKFADAGSCKGILHDFTPHAGDWESGDPTWANDRGKSLIGLVNYIASTGVNAIYIMANTVRGDGCDAHPWSEYNADGTVKRFDVSKLDQWERVLTHMTKNGILIHLMTQETENDQLLNNGDLGLERKLYYRELISRFGHHPALQWNLGEENTNTDAQRKAYSDFIKQQDPYDHPILMHTFPGEQDQYDALLGYPTFDGPTIQFGGIPNNPDANNGVYNTAVNWITQSTDAGRPWVVTFTEASGANAPQPNSNVTSRQRIYWMWASVMSGGAGFEWYLKNAGAGHAYDLAVENLREFDEHWQQSGHLVRFFQDIVQQEHEIDLQDLQIDNTVTTTSTDWVLSNSTGTAYIVYLREGGSTEITLPNNSSYQVHWFNPRSGEASIGNVIQGAGNQSVGAPPTEASQDWTALIIQTNNVAADYTQVNGLVIMEAENTQSGFDLWVEETEVSGFTGDSYIEFTGNNAQSGPPKSPLSYTFSINQDGLHHLHLLVARETLTINGEVRTDVANDAYVRLSGDFSAGPNVGNSHGDDAPLSTLRSDTKFFGGDDNNFVWASGNRLDLGGDTNKRVAVYDLKAGQTYTLTLSGRSKFFKVDRIMFRHLSVPKGTAEDTSLPETR